MSTEYSSLRAARQASCGTSGILSATSLDPPPAPTGGKSSRALRIVNQTLIKKSKKNQVRFHDPIIKIYPNTNYFKLLINFGLGIEKPAKAHNTFDTNILHHLRFISKVFVLLSAFCESGQYANDPTDCTRYLHCLFGKFEEFSCSAGLHWNQVLLTQLKKLLFYE